MLALTKLPSAFRKCVQQTAKQHGGLLLGVVASVVPLSASALSGPDFQNSASITSSADQFEPGLTNNVSSVQVLPKGITITKTADGSALSSPTAAGDLITYQIVVTNTGLLELTNVVLADSIIPSANLSLVSGDIDNDGVLDGQEVWTFAATYAITQADLDSNGNGDADIDNTVTVTTAELPSAQASAEIPITQAPAFTIDKVVDSTTIATPTTLNYTITVTNTGNLTLSGVTLNDVLPDGSPAVLVGPVADIGVAGSIDVGESWEYTTSFNAVQADIDSGAALVNTVSATTTETGSSVLSASAQTDVNAVADFEITKIVDAASINQPATLNYTVTLENTGTISLTGIALSDTLPDGSAGTLTGPATDTGIANVLDVGESWIYTLPYAATQQDIDTGAVLTNSVSATTTETGTQVKQDTAETSIDQAPEFSVTKNVDLASIDLPSLLSYVITVENTGNQSLTNIVITDTAPDGSVATVTGPTGDGAQANVLDVGETWQYTTSYTATQADLDAGAALVNSVEVSVDEITDTESATASTNVSATPEMSISKTVDIASINAPQTLSYTIEVENTGNVSLNNVVLNDTLPDGSIATLTGPVADSGVVGALDVGEIWEYTTTYSVSQVEIDDGATLANTVAVTADELNGVSFSDSAVTTINRIPDFTLEKVVDQSSINQPGILNYTITAENIGNVSLGNIVISDTLPDGTPAVLIGPLTDIGVTGRIDVGESWTWTGTYNVTQDDVNAGDPLVNEVTVSTDEAGSATANVETVVSQVPGITIDKVGDTALYVAAGDVLDYTFTITNVGNVALSSITVTDPNADPGSIVCAPSIPNILLPGGAFSCSATHTVTAGDVAFTQVNNQAFVNAVTPDGTDLLDPSDVVTVPMDRLPPIATDDNFISPVSAVAVTLPGAANDSDPNGDLLASSLSVLDPQATDLDGDGDFDSLIVAGEGAWLVDPVTGTVQFTPEPGFSADPTPVPYTISDATGLVSQQALLTVDYPQTAPVAKNDFKANPNVPAPGNPTTLNVFADNGDGVDSDPENDIVVTSVNLVDTNATDSDGDGDADTLVVAGEGTWVVDNNTGDITFTPIAGFFSDPTPIDYLISDGTGLNSNIATVTVDYPQSAPIAVDDQMLDQPLGQAVTLAALANDSDPENNLVIGSLVLLEPVTGAPVTSLIAAGQGVWVVDPATGNVTFTPEPGFLGDPTPVQYTISDSTGLTSNTATLTVTYEEPATLAGTVWLDSDRDGQIGIDEERKPGWILRIVNDAGVVVATTTTDANGDYLVTGLIPGVYTVQFFNQNDVFIDSLSTVSPLLAGQTVNLPLPVDPSGVVYDSISRVPVAGVTLNLLNSSGVVIDEACLGQNQQGQVTTADGLYAFDVLPNAHPSCPAIDVYQIDIAAVPAIYFPTFSSIIREQGASNCGGPLLGCAVSAVFDSSSSENACTFDSLPGTDACEVQAQPDAPVNGEDTRYYVEFELESGDTNVIFNHLPLDARQSTPEILLSKTVDQREASAGGVVQYTLNVENLKDIPAVDIQVFDDPPPGFTIEPGSVQLLRAGADGELGTADDVANPLSLSAANLDGDTVVFDAIDLEPEETARITYLSLISVGVIEGDHVNTAFAEGPSGIASNTVTATVVIVADPVLDQATLIGKVFNDHDGDGLQETADATSVVIKSDYYGWNSLPLPDLAGRRSINDDPSRESVTVKMPITDSNEFRIETAEGTRVSVDENGTITEAHIGAKARGLNAQDIRVCTQHVNSWYTNRDGFLDNSEGELPVLEITISNHGISERGLPGVRLATVSGLVIETDAHGRFNIPDVDAGTGGFGKNFILKVDPASLPYGSRFTTENPYVLRIVNTGLNRMNFGVQVDHGKADRFARGVALCSSGQEYESTQDAVVEVSLGSIFFDTDSAKVRADQAGIVEDIVTKLREYGGGTIVVEAHADSRGSAQYNLDLAERRANAIRTRLRDALGDKLMESVSVEVDPQGLVESTR